MKPLDLTFWELMHHMGKKNREAKRNNDNGYYARVFKKVKEVE
jgi:hypothetical protein